MPADQIRGPAATAAARPSPPARPRLSPTPVAGRPARTPTAHRPAGTTDRTAPTRRASSHFAAAGTTAAARGLRPQHTHRPLRTDPLGDHRCQHRPKLRQQQPDPGLGPITAGPPAARRIHRRTRRRQRARHSTPRHAKSAADHPARPTPSARLNEQLVQLRTVGSVLAVCLPGYGFKLSVAFCGAATGELPYGPGALYRRPVGSAGGFSCTDGWRSARRVGRRIR